MTDDNKKADDVKTEQTATLSSQTPAAGLKRRELLRNVGVGSVATGLGAATYLRGFDRSRMRAMAQDGGPVKIGFIEDESGNLAVYGLQTRLAATTARHAARRHVIKAVVALMQRHGIDDDEAFAMLRRESMARRVTVEELSCQLVEKHEDDRIRRTGSG